MQSISARTPRVNPADGQPAVAAESRIPRARHVAARPRLHDRLTEMVDSPITLISAPAGYGKTLLTAAWVSVRGDLRVGWLTLRTPDNAVQLFWRNLGAALREALPTTDRAQLDVVLQESMNALAEIPTRIAEVIDHSASTVLLVLDNLHLVGDAEVHSAILQLSSSSRYLRVIAVTRHDPPWPLHTMRLDGRVQELRAADLAFDETEALAMFSTLDLEVTTDQVELLVARTEGWAAGLRLAALGISSSPDREEFIAEFSGDEHIVADYLMREVLDRQPADWQDFLMRIAIVEEVCGDLADALTGADDGDRRLSQLANANLFVHEVGSTGRWYRLHRLLVDFLDARLTDQRLRRDLNRRAADWFRSQHMPMQALRYALAGRHWGLAADLVAVHVATLVARHPPAELEAALAPLPLEVLLAHPGLAIGLAAARAMQGDLSDVDALTDAARTHLPRLSETRRRRFEVVLDTVEVGRRRLTGDVPGTLQACRRVPIDTQTLAALGLQSWNAVRVVVLSNMGSSELWLGELSAAREHLDAAGQAAGGALLPRLNARAHSALLEWLCGDLDEALTIAQQTVAELSRTGLALAWQCVSAYLSLAGVAFDRDELYVADRWLDLGQDAAVEPHAVVAVAVLRARRHAAHGQFDEGLAALRSARHRVLDAPMPALLADRSLLVEAELLRRSGNRADAHGLTARVSDPTSWVAGRDRVRTALDAGDLPADQPDAWPAPSGLREDVQRQVLAARWAHAAADHETALIELERALGSAAPQMLRRPFLDDASALAPLLRERIALGTGSPQFAVDLLNRMSGAASGGAGPRATLVVPLTQREGLMLRYLASTMTNADISRALFISMNTVKTHQRMIYRKLAVNDRRDAVARGRELGLL